MPWVGEEGSVREVESGCENGREGERGEARGALKMVRNVYVFCGWWSLVFSLTRSLLFALFPSFLFMLLTFSLFFSSSFAFSLGPVSHSRFSTSFLHFLFSPCLTSFSLFITLYYPFLTPPILLPSQSFLATLLLFSSLIPFIVSCTFPSLVQTFAFKDGW